MRGAWKYFVCLGKFQADNTVANFPSSKCKVHKVEERKCTEFSVTSRTWFRCARNMNLLVKQILCRFNQFMGFFNELFGILLIFSGIVARCNKFSGTRFSQLSLAKKRKKVPSCWNFFTFLLCRKYLWQLKYHNLFELLGVKRFDNGVKKRLMNLCYLQRINVTKFANFPSNYTKEWSVFQNVLSK